VTKVKLKTSSSTNVRTMHRFFLLAVVSMAILSHSNIAVVVNALSSAPKKYYGGAGVGRFVVEDEQRVVQQRCHYDMILAERIQGKPRTESGLYVPQEDLPKLHLCRVIAVGPGREEENGLIAPMPDIVVGDIIVAKNPWGIGPKDEETADGKKLSFMRAQDVAAVVTGGLAPEE
jgi:co-chaperonin GroES (HSP10)